MDASGKRLLALEFFGDKLHLVDLEEGTSALIWRAATSSERLSIPSYSADLSRVVGVRGVTPLVWDVPIPRILFLRPAGTDIEVFAATVAGGVYSLLRSGAATGTWDPVARGTATGDAILLTDTNALAGDIHSRFYRVALE